MRGPLHSGGEHADTATPYGVFGIINAATEEVGSLARTFGAGGTDRVGPDLRSVTGLTLVAESDTSTWRRLWTGRENPGLDVSGGKLGFRSIADGQERAAVIAWTATPGAGPIPFGRVEQPVRGEGVRDR